MRNMLLKTGAKAIHVVKCGKNLAELSSRVRCKTELARDELGSLAKEVSKPSVGGVTWLLPVPYRKVQEERCQSWKEL